MPLPPIIVSSTSKFSDCWEPFATLLARYWPAHPPAFLVTEKLDREPPANLSPIVTGLAQTPEAWSSGLSHAIGEVGAEVFLYMQDDYFIRGEVDQQMLGQAAQLVRSGVGACVRLRETLNSGPWRDHEAWIREEGDLWRVDRRSRYLLSLQAAYWSAAAFKDLLVDGETPWDFELKGSVRARARGLEVLCLSIDRYRGGSEPLPYLATGVVKGSWHPQVPSLFEKEGLSNDLEARPVLSAGEFESHRSFWSRLRRRLPWPT